MCPFCFSIMAVVVVGAASSGGLAAIVVEKLRAHRDAKTLISQTKGEENAPKIVSPSEWVEARKQFLIKEKEFTRLRDELSRERHELAWERVDKNYVFDGSNGNVKLADLMPWKNSVITGRKIIDEMV